MRYLSLFSGVEAASQAWERLGWVCVAVSEIEPGPCAVLKHRYPHVPNLGDVTKIGLCARYDPLHVMRIATKYPASRLATLYINLARRMESLGLIDLIVFGSPCQDLSVAGKRKGFTNDDGQLTRSGLFHIAVDIVRWARRRWGARFALWENVPGAFTSNAGRDFAAVVDQLAGLEGTAVPPKGWGTEGCAVGAEAMVEWATLDAQWAGVAQRRRRVFAFADFGDWASRPPVLLEPEGMRGDSAPRREAGQDVAGTLSARTQGGGGLGTDFDLAGSLVPVGVYIRNGVITGAVAHTIQSGHHAPDPGGTPHAMVFGGNNTSGPISVSPTLNAHGGPVGRLDFDSEAFVVVPHPVAYRVAGDGAAYQEGDCTAPLTTGTDPNAHLIAYSGPQAISFEPRYFTRDNKTGGAPSTTVQLSATGAAKAGDAAPCVAYREMQAWQWRVRRLTPRECERLQGMADDFTLVNFRGKPMADGPRYKAIGNSMAVVVMAWIGRKINQAVIHQEFFQTRPACSHAQLQ